MIRRGSMQVLAGALDELSPDDRKLLLQKVKEKLMDKLNLDTDSGADNNTEGNGTSSNNADNSTDDSINTDTDTGTDEVNENTDNNTNNDNEQPNENTELDDDSNNDESKTASNATGKGNKDKDTMADTGGIGKHKLKPNKKPPRNDSAKRYNFDKIKKEDRRDYKDTVGDPDLKKNASRRGRYTK